ncbi:MAG: hypothetical protein AAF288_10310 [Planctomycetota bacterium]
MPVVCAVSGLAAAGAQADVRFSGDLLYEAEVAIWWTPFFDQDSTEQPRNWGSTRYDAVHVDNNGQPALGQYNSDWIPTIDNQIAQMRSAGVDFVISDLTNGYGAGGPETEVFISRGTMPVAAAIGGPLQRPVGWMGLTNAEIEALANTEANAVWNNLVSTGNYATKDGKPLLITYMAYDGGIAKVPVPFYEDSRFQMERATGGTSSNNPNLDFANYNNQWDSWWGWHVDQQIASPTAMIVNPGHDTVHVFPESGSLRDRENGRRYQDMWINTIQQDPEYVVIASWNDLNEENHIEPSRPSNQTTFDPAPAWNDINGNQTDDLYLQMTRGYTALRSNRLLEGYYYAEEAGPNIYRVQGDQLVLVGAVNQIAAESAIVRLPDGLLTDIATTRTLTDLADAPITAPLLVEGFDNGQGDWAVRNTGGAPPSSVTFGNELVLSKGANAQPTSAYHLIDDDASPDGDGFVLAEGDILRVSFDATVSRTDPRNNDLRVALGFADPAVAGDLTGALAVPMDGYYLTIPTNGSGSLPSVQYQDSMGGARNFFNDGANVQSLGLLDEIGTVMSSGLTDVVFEIERDGNGLLFSAVIDGIESTQEVRATGAEVLDLFTFNTLAFAYLFSPGESATLDNVLVELITRDFALLGDFDRSGGLTATDIDLLVENFGDGGFDLDGDGDADTDDLTALVTGGRFLDGFFGDANTDGVVDLLDFDALAVGFGGAGGWGSGDFNGDGGVDLLDFDLLAQNFGDGSAAVAPEPSGLLLLAPGLAGLCRRRRSRRAGLTGGVVSLRWAP